VYTESQSWTEHEYLSNVNGIAVHRGGLSLLHKVLRVVSGVLVRDAAARGEALNGRPYYRIFLGLIAELAPAFPADPEADPARLSLIAMVAHVLEELQPQRVPGFAFPWLELISHRCASCLTKCQNPLSLPLYTTIQCCQAQMLVVLLALPPGFSFPIVDHICGSLLTH
jgi:hypothetical protein